MQSLKSVSIIVVLFLAVTLSLVACDSLIGGGDDTKSGQASTDGSNFAIPNGPPLTYDSGNAKLLVDDLVALGKFLGNEYNGTVDLTEIFRKIAIAQDLPIVVNGKFNDDIHRWGPNEMPSSTGGQPDFGWNHDANLPSAPSVAADKAARGIIANAALHPVFYAGDGYGAMNRLGGSYTNAGRPGDYAQAGYPYKNGDDPSGIYIYTANDGAKLYFCGYDFQHQTSEFIFSLAKLPGYAMVPTGLEAYGFPEMVDAADMAKVILYFLAFADGGMMRFYKNLPIYSEREVGRSIRVILNAMKHLVHPADVEALKHYIEVKVIDKYSVAPVLSIFNKSGDQMFYAKPTWTVPIEESDMFYAPWQIGLAVPPLWQAANELYYNDAAKFNQVMTVTKRLAQYLHDSIQGDGMVPAGVILPNSYPMSGAPPATLSNYVSNATASYEVYGTPAYYEFMTWVYTGERVAAELGIPGAQAMADSMLQKYKSGVSGWDDTNWIEWMTKTDFSYED